MNGFSKLEICLAQTKTVPQFTFSSIWKVVLTVFSFNLGFRDMSCDWLRGNFLRCHVHSSFLLSSPGSFLCLLRAKNIKLSLAFGFSFSKLFGFGGCLSLLSFSFS